MSLSPDAIRDALAALTDPNLGTSLGKRAIAGLETEGGTVRVRLALDYPVATMGEAVREAVTQALSRLPGVESVQVELLSCIEIHKIPPGTQPLPGVANVIAVASGKGGVGKSTTAVNLALALLAEGARVGVLDADIYGPSIPQMLGLGHQPPESTDGKSMEPLMAHGLQVNSIGFLVDPETPMIWRGPMASQALLQLLTQTNWHELDYLVVDLPPGTGDIQLTLSQKAPLTGALIVTTPQDIALLDARKAVKMFQKVNVPVLGLVENMSIHVCSNCGHAEPIFGSGGGEKMAQEYGLPFLGALPLDIRIRKETDSGTPTVVAEPEGPIAARYRDIARRVALALARAPRDLSHKFPTVVVQNR